ncbi:flippase-like domain-containing protein [Mycoplasmopsis phocirhinis]|uniref:Flippase-like domain-containing protein n=1 Tax=Mycoplasmopsis phocirhinis TaxID=142650 RepID=A0A4P6MPX8_9BACT|nr:lysylphosphatidylglycerol synthase transmembrane domain-containing protein [Mycoplasmopsis phocirhinis]QBF34806.1 flippase-like domain-containing protein [Mycoplasmopsis phocirhinis]
MQSLIQKWKKYHSPDVFFNKLLKKTIFVSNNKLKNAFKQPILFCSNKIIAPVGLGTNVFNDFTVYSLAQSISLLIKSKQISNKNILLLHDKSVRSYIYLNIFAKALTANNFNVITINQNELIPSSYKHYIVKKTNSVFYIDIGELNSKTRLMKIEFNWKDNQFSENDLEYLKKLQNSLNFDNLNLPLKNPVVKKISLWQTLLNDIKNISAYDDDFSNLKFGVHVTNSAYEQYNKNLYQNIGINYNILNSSKPYDNNLKLADLSSINTRFFLSKNDLNFVLNKANNSLIMAAKHKNVYKYFRSEELAAIYLHFLLNDSPDFDRSKLAKYVVARSIETTPLIDLIATKNKIDFIEYHCENELFEYLKKNNKTLLFAHNHENNFFFEHPLTNSDASVFSIELMKIAAFYKKRKQSLYDVLINIYQSYGYINSIKKTIDMSPKSFNIFMERVKNNEAYGKVKVINTKNYPKNNNLSPSIFKIFLNDNSTIVFKYNLLRQNLLLVINTREKKNIEDSRLDVVVREKELLNNLLDLKDNEISKSAKIKNIVKYLIFSILFIGIFVFLFQTVYNFKTQGSLSYNLFDVITSMWTHIKTNIFSRASFLAIIATFLLTSIINAIIFKRLLNWQGVKVRFRDLIIGSLISTVSQNITPKSIGGDIATFWYLRRRNVPRDKLLSAIVVNTFIWQISNIILVLIFIPIGIKFYGNFFNNSTGGTNLILLISLILGIFIDSVLALAFLILSLSSKIQNFVLKHLLKFLEWLPFIALTNPQNLHTKLQYEFYKVRQGLKTIIKKWYNFIEILVWKLLPWLYVPIALFAMSIDVIKIVPGGAYFNIMTADVLIRNINSISPTPGGTGTSDIIRKIIFEFIIKPDPSGTLSISQRSSLLTSISGVGTVVIPTILSALIMLLVFIGEGRVNKYNNQQKNILLNINSNLVIKRSKTRYYKISFSILTILIAVLALVFIFNKW